MGDEGRSEMLTMRREAVAYASAALEPDLGILAGFEGHENGSAVGARRFADPEEATFLEGTRASEDVAGLGAESTTVNDD